MGILVAVGTQNLAKITAAENAFKKIFGDCEVKGVSASSGVSETPMSFEETATGAINRAKAALDLLKSDFGVGLEGGVEKTNLGAFMLGVVAIIDKKGNFGISRGGEILLPEKIVKGLQQGRKMSELFEELLRDNELKAGEESIGYFTKGIIDRTHGFEDIVVCALARFIRSELY